jgi:hypothetical protein
VFLDGVRQPPPHRFRHRPRWHKLALRRDRMPTPDSLLSAR